MTTTLSPDVITELIHEDNAHLIHPQWYAPDHQAPVIFDHGEGSWLYDVQGRRYLDALSSLWNVAVGHGRAELADVAAAQMRRVAFTNNYVGFSNAPAIRLAAKVASLAYDNLSGVFFTNSGSESNEGALKVARFYWNLKGRGSKNRLIARERSYHGGTLATSSMTGLPAFWKYFGPLVPEIVRATKPDNLECDCEKNSDGECACWLEAAIQREGAENVAAFIGEPVKGAGGVWTPAPEYWPKVREICDRYEVLLIADEVITGFGRTGKWFAPRALGRPARHPQPREGHHLRLHPDGRVHGLEGDPRRPPRPAARRPLHARLHQQRPPRRLRRRPPQPPESSRTSTSSSAPPSSASGSAPASATPSASTGTSSNIRHLGLIAGLTLVKDADAGGTPEAYDVSEAVGARVARHLREEGEVITRFVGDQLVFAPPLSSTEEDIDFLVDATAPHRAVTDCDCARWARHRSP